MSSAYRSLRDPLLALTSSLASTRSAALSSSSADPASNTGGPLPALDAEELRGQVDSIWAKVKAQLDEQDRIRSEGLAKNGQSSTAAAAVAEVAESGGERVTGEGEAAEAATRSKLEEEKVKEKKREQLKLDLIRGWMELLGKEVVVLPLVAGELDESEDPREQSLYITSIQDRLDVMLTLYEVVHSSLALKDPIVLDPGSTFIPLLEELVELISVETWRVLWKYVESRSKRFTKNMPAFQGRGKVLALLRLMNAFLRFLPRTPEDLVFRGRVHQFASGVIDVADKSAINVKGDFGGMEVAWDEAYGRRLKGATKGEEGVEKEEKGEEGEGQGGDVDMEGSDTKEEKEKVKVRVKDEVDVDDPATSPKFYANLWSLQKYFANPTTLDGPSVPVEVDIEVEVEVEVEADVEAGKKPADGKADPSDSSSKSKASSSSAAAKRTQTRKKTVKRNETKLTVETPLETFKRKTDLILPVLYAQTDKEKALMGVAEAEGGVAATASGSNANGSGRKRKRDDASLSSKPTTTTTTTTTDHSVLESPTSTSPSSEFFHPRYLTPPNLLAYELADLSFRRQILVQYFILFQFLLLLTPDNKFSQTPNRMGNISKNFILGEADITWARGKVRAIRAELVRLGTSKEKEEGGGGKRWCEAVLGVISQEKHYANWKMEACPESIFEIPPLPAASAGTAASAWAARLKPPRPFPYKVGSRSLSLMWRGGFESLDQLRGWKRASTFESLEEEIRRMVDDMEDDKAMGKVQSKEEERAFAEAITKLTYRALRLKIRTNLRHFKGMANQRDIGVLMKHIKEDEERLARLGASRLNSASATATPGMSSNAEVEAGAGREGAGDQTTEGQVGGGEDGDTDGAVDAVVEDAAPEPEAGQEAEAPAPAEQAVEAEAETRERVSAEDGIQTPAPASPVAPATPTAEAANDNDATIAVERTERKVSGTRRGADEMDDVVDRDEVKRAKVEGEDVDMDAADAGGRAVEGKGSHEEEKEEREEEEERVSTPVLPEATLE